MQSLGRKHGTEARLDTLPAVSALLKMTLALPSRCRDRLAVVYYAHRGWSLHNRSYGGKGPPNILNTRFLNCSVARAFEMLGNKTKVDVIIVAPPHVVRRDGFPHWLAQWPRLFLYPQIDVEPPPGVHGGVRQRSLDTWQSS